MSYKNHWAISMFTVVPVSYNTVDENYRIHQCAPLPAIDNAFRSLTLAPACSAKDELKA
jgi:hypothetical protein